MYLIVFVGLAWFLTAPAMAVLIGKVVSTADRRTHTEARSAVVEAGLRRDARVPVAGRH